MYCRAGTVFVIQSPTPIHRFMGGNSHPIVDCKREIYPLYGTFRMTDVPLPVEVVYSGLRTNNMTVQVLSIAAVSTQ